MEIGHRPPPGVAPRPCPAPAAPALLFLSLRAGAGLRAGPASGAACGLRGTGSGVSWTREQGPRNTVRRGRRKTTELLWLPRSGVRPGSPRPGPGHLPMSPSSSSSSSSSMFSRTFLLIIFMSPQYRRSAPLGAARLHSARAASSAQPSRHSLLHSARALLL